ncbi:MAG: cysteine--tRNA ligase, partial [Candidatus Omnitrophota bacterium]
GKKLWPLRQMMKEISYVFGFSYEPRIKTADIADEEVASLIAARKAFKAGRKFKEADEIRVQLELKGVILEDTKDGTTWRRKL